MRIRLVCDDGGVDFLGIFFIGFLCSLFMKHETLNFALLLLCIWCLLLD